MSLVGYLVAGDLQVGGSIALICMVKSFFVFILHERVWAWFEPRGQDPNPGQAAA